MKKPIPAESRQREPRRKPGTQPRAADLQPAATGANRGSPAASVMKQFAKTRTESGGRS